MPEIDDAKLKEIISNKFPDKGNRNKFDQFDAPVPGESLTQPQGNARYEHAPQFPDPNDALVFLFDKLTEEDNLKNMLALLDAEIPAETVARTNLFAGFMEGKWTPDVIMAIAKPHLAQIVMLAKRSGMENVKVSLDDKEEDGDLVRLEVLNKLKKDQDKPAIENVAMDDVPKQGLLSPRGAV